MSFRSRARAVLLLLGLGLCCLLAGSCQRQPAPAAAPATPVRAVEALVAQLRAGDLAGYARAAVPPALQPQLEAAWRDGRSRWPLSELPFAGRLPTVLATFAAEGSEARLQALFERQFAHADRELEAAATSLGLFGVQYVNHEGDFSDEERRHYAQLIQALGAWGAQAPLADPARARQAIARLALAARGTGLADPGAFRAAGMDGSLRKLQPFFSAFKRTLAGYGLDLDLGLAGLRAELVEEHGDRARVRVRYRLGQRDIDAVVSLQRQNGRWYLADSLRNAQASLQAPVRTAPATVAAPTP